MSSTVSGRRKKGRGTKKKGNQTKAKGNWGIEDDRSVGVVSWRNKKFARGGKAKVHKESIGREKTHQYLISKL